MTRRLGAPGDWFQETVGGRKLMMVVSVLAFYPSRRDLSLTSQEGHRPTNPTELKMMYQK